MREVGNENNRENVGKLARDLQLQNDDKINPIDLQRAIHEGKDGKESYEAQLLACLERGKKSMDGPFYIVVLFKKERIMHNVVRQYFFFRHTCPTPEYDQTVYRYNPSDEELRYIWSVPDKDTTYQIYLSRGELSPEYVQLGEFCRDFVNGDLDKKCAALNGEEWIG